jgi:UDP-GlcNAc:undecaprenyl-phosphate/decaprenyl-phosphate GlcNAc-1-phosphate transferase
VLAVPILDVGFAIVRRLRHHRPVFAPDKEHLHHQLREIGHTHRQAVLIMYVWSILLAGSGLAITFINGRELVGAILAVSILLIGLTFIPSRIRRRRAIRRAERAAAAERRGAKVETKSA